MVDRYGLEASLDVADASGIKCRVDFTPGDIVNLRVVLDRAIDEDDCGGGGNVDRLRALDRKIKNCTPVPPESK